MTIIAIIAIIGILVGAAIGWAIWSPYKEVAEGWKRNYEQMKNNNERLQELMLLGDDDSNTYIPDTVDMRELHQMD